MRNKQNNQKTITTVRALEAHEIKELVRQGKLPRDWAALNMVGDESNKPARRGRRTLWVFILAIALGWIVAVILGLWLGWLPL